jgi:Phospholipase B/Carbohydrate binding domain
MFRLTLALCAVCVLDAATPLFNRSFDERNSGWTAVHGSANVDSSVLHDGKKSLRVERAPGAPDAAVRSAPVSLAIGKRYELYGWVRTEDLSVSDSARTPIGSGAALTMASMPFDVHSASLGGTQAWTRLTLRFTATRASDQILLIAGNSGTLHGKAWFEGVAIEEVSGMGDWPAREAVQTFGPAYRYPAAGWIYLHIEGAPYERGYQHGYLMAREIPEYLTRCAFELAGRSDKDTWDQYRTWANALFLRGFDKEILEEMRGIADGANANGAKWLGRKVDLIDIVVANTTVEMGELDSAMPMTRTGLEGTHFDAPSYAPAPKHDAPTDHCSAFAATGPATADGKMIIGHVTWWPLTLAEQTNVMLDIQPAAGHRILMQSYPGGIESGTDWYQNDAGMVLTETTIRQTPFNVRGTPVAFRARIAIQYGGNVDELVERLGTRNNGLYTNEWIIGDGKNNEIAMYELGTDHTKLWRSSRNEWFGGTPGFYWGNNNAKDMEVKLEYLPDPAGTPEYVPFVPAIRDLAWQRLYDENKGRIDEQFGFTAFRTAPLVSAATMDAKIATADLANHLMVWAEIGRPNESVWSTGGRRHAEGPNHGLYPGGYYLFSAEPSEPLKASIRENESVRLAAAQPEEKPKKPSPNTYKDRLWKGWILPATDADTWFVAGSAAYYHILEKPDLEKSLEAARVEYRGLKLSPDDPLTRYRIERSRGVLFLDALRRKLGDDAFLKLMREYFASNTTKTVTAQSFLQTAGVSFEFPDPGDGPAWLPDDIGRRGIPVAIVYGTVREAGANRYTAEQLQARLREEQQREFTIYKDFEVSDDKLVAMDVIFVGRPETNSALAAWAGKIGLDYAGAVFRIEGKPYASERNSLVFAAKNPLDGTRMVLVYAGNSPLATARSLTASATLPFTVLEDGKPAGPSVTERPEDGRSSE